MGAAAAKSGGERGEPVVDRAGLAPYLRHHGADPVVPIFEVLFRQVLVAHAGDGYLNSRTNQNAPRLFRVRGQHKDVRAPPSHLRSTVGAANGHVPSRGVLPGSALLGNLLVMHLTCAPGKVRDSIDGRVPPACENAWLLGAHAAPPARGAIGRSVV